MLIIHTWAGPNDPFTACDEYLILRRRLPLLRLYPPDGRTIVRLENIGSISQGISMRMSIIIVIIIIIIPRWAGPNDPPKLALILPRWAGPNDPRRLASNILRLEINRGVRLGISDLSFFHFCRRNTKLFVICTDWFLKVVYGGC